MKTNEAGTNAKPARRFLVPTDFTAVADYAMDHAMKLANTMGTEVYLLHMVPDMEEEEAVQHRLNAEMERAQAINAHVPVRTMLRQGKVYAGIGEAAKEIGAELIIMGTHGMRGMQFITGSRALRVITNSEVPFIVVQERGLRPAGYQNIVVPMDLQRETRQNLGLVAAMASFFKAKVHVVVPKEKDEFLHRQLQDNIIYARKFLGGHGIAMEAFETKGDSKGFVKATLEYAQQIDADLIAVMNMTGTNIFGALGVPYEEEMITNKALIPVMMLNPVNNTAGITGWTFQ